MYVCMYVESERTLHLGEWIYFWQNYRDLRIAAKPISYNINELAQRKLIYSVLYDFILDG